jgi:type I restriction enzyme, R subunit
MPEAFIHNETRFEQEVVDLLLSSKEYTQGLPVDFNRETALLEKYLFDFIQTSQPKEWKKLSTIHGEQVKKQFLHRLFKEIASRGLLDVIRNGFTTHGVNFKLAYFKPSSNLNAQSLEQFNQNQLTVIRQVKYDRHNENSIDLLIALNGFSIITIELKNAFSGQTVKNAMNQYRFHRDPREPLFLFNKGSLVHFSVDTDSVHMTTKVNGSKTLYLPFNKGRDNGAGNPDNPQGRKTDYLWTEIFRKDSLMEIVGRFIHLEKDDKGKWSTLIFPRYHQMDSVRKMVADAKVSGAGKNYLIQHSAGSGKSNSIAWLSYRLASLHDENDQRVFDSVIVVTDRKVLDNQLQDTIYQFEHKMGVVQKIDKNSKQLAEALTSGTNIIITTLQKFPFVIEHIASLPARKYAVIVDEAHSSQGGEASKKMKEVLSAKTLEEAELEDIGVEDDAEDEIRKSMMARGRQSNLSFFAFTATPKFKTLEVFGVKGLDGKPRPFHTYSMKQAIEEGFILDVLKNYITYKTFFRLSKKIADDPEVNKTKTAIAIARFLTLHPHNLAQKTEVMVEHFRQVVSKKINGHAKAMVVTPSRLHAVRYKQEFDRYIKEKKYLNIHTLVAFSGTVYADGLEYTEPNMTGYSEKELPKKFDTDAYQLLIVADKYQTGYDQPLLHTMYVDKKLSGVKAVQTLSRLNRTHPGKDDTFILDFANDEQDILDSFQPYYEHTTVDETSDPDHLYDLKTKIDSFKIIWETEIENFCHIFYKKKEKLEAGDHARLNSMIDPAVDRFRYLPSDEQREDFKHALTSFLRLYSFLTQIMPFYDIKLEKLYTYSRFLLKKLPKDPTTPFQLGDDVSLEYYRLQKISDKSFILEDDPEGYLSGIKDAGSGKVEEEKAHLSEIIEVLNERFGTEFKEADRIFFHQIEEEMAANTKLQEQAQSNTIENFKYGFEDAFIASLIKRMDQNQEIFTKIMDDEEFSKVVKNLMLEKVYSRLRETLQF